MAESDELIAIERKGSTIPRYYTRPLPGREKGEGCVKGCDCGLTRKTSRGFQVLAWAKRMGFRLMPWQRWLLVHAMELNAQCNGYRFRTVLVIVARQNGKTFLKAILSLWRMYERNERYLVGVAQDLSQAREVMAEVMVPIMQDHKVLKLRFDPDAEHPDDRIGMWHKTLNDEYVRLDVLYRGQRSYGPRGPRYMIKALNRKAGRGLSGVTEVNIDELREQRDFLGWAAVSKTIMAQPDAQIWCMSNAGDSQAVVLNHLRSVGLSGSTDNGDESMFMAEWSAVEGCAMDDRDQWAQANPSMGYPKGVSESAIASALRIDPPSVFRTEVLCQFVDVMNRAIDNAAWTACSDPLGFSGKDGGRLILCLERAVDRDEIACCSAVVLDDERVKVDLVGIWHGVDGAKEELIDLCEALDVKMVGWYPRGPGATMSSMLRKFRRPKSVEIRGERVSEAHMHFADLVDARKVLHPDDLILNKHISQASPIGNATSWIFDRSAAIDTHAAWAAAGAVSLAMNLPSKPRRRAIILADSEED